MLEFAHFFASVVFSAFILTLKDFFGALIDNIYCIMIEGLP